METTDRPGLRHLILLPAAIEPAAGPHDGRQPLSGASHSPDSAQPWPLLAWNARRFLDRPLAACARYGSDGHRQPWLLLAAGGSEAQTLDRVFLPGTAYRLSLACSDVFGCTDQRLTVALTGGATACATFAVPANEAAGGGGWSFVLCGLEFTPTSPQPVNVRLTNAVAADHRQPLASWLPRRTRC